MDHQHAAGEHNSSPVITGVRSIPPPPQIKIHDRVGDEKWTWTPCPWNGVPAWAIPDLCNGRSVTEIKWAKPAATGDKVKIVAIVNSAAIVLDYADSKLDFVTRITNSHTLELLPDNFLAVATSGKTQNDGIAIYDMKAYEPGFFQLSSPEPVQNITGFPAVHGLVFDPHSHKLWAAGNDKSPDGNEGPSRSFLKAYAFNDSTAASRQQPVNPNAVHAFNISEPVQLDVEWKGTQFHSWWNGAHDLIPVPNTRTLLITSDLDVHAFDIEASNFRHGKDVASQFLPGFVPVGERIGMDGQKLPRSDIKGISINAAGDYLYVQSKWKDWFADNVRIVEGENQNTYHDVEISQRVYKSRWFEGVAGWSSVTHP